MKQAVCLSQSLTRDRTREAVAELCSDPWKEGFRACALHNSSAF